MNQKFIGTYLNDGIFVNVHFDYQPKEPETQTYPGCPASVEINGVLIGTNDIMPVLSESALNDLEDKCLESMSQHTD